MTAGPVAVVGYGCRLPGGVVDGRSLWRLLAGGVDAIREIPPDRWSVPAFVADRPGIRGKSASRWGGFLEQVDRFEPECFGISPREADYVDPQQRLLLECAWEALELAGLPLDGLVGSPTGVFVGLSTGDYAQVQRSYLELRGLSAFTAHGTAASSAANRISYCLDLRGPSFTVDTACSSSLVAVDRAVRSLEEGESELALAGGANVILTPESFVSFSQASMLSPEGRCKAFDASADGFVRSEGAAVVVLKPLARAERDGDPIHAVILGTGVNQDGRTGGLSMPNPDSQAALIREVHQRAGIAPEDVAYVEAHGTGTAVGDPAEAKALGDVFAPGRDPDRALVMGSLKSNLGHLEAGSGVASLLKVILMLGRRRIPPSLHFRTPNPEIPFEAWRLRVPVTLERWPDDGPAVAGINSFGFGGTNAHAVLTEHRSHGGLRAPAIGDGGPGRSAGEEPSAGRAVPLLLAARSPEALAGLAERWVAFLEDPPELEDVAYTAALRRTHYPHRLGLAARDPAEAQERLRAFAASETRPGLHAGRRRAEPPPVAFVFSGQGPQWHAMGRELQEAEPVFATALEECDDLLRPHLGWSVIEEISGGEERSRMGRTSVAQPALFALQVALTELWASRGVRPAAVLGHSVGEIAAAWASGILSLPAAARLVAHRGRCLQDHARPGRMLAAALSEEEVAGLLPEEEVCVAALNGPRMLTLAGEADAVARAAERLGEADVWCRELQVGHAFHSPLVEPARRPFLEGMGSVDPAPPRTPMISTVTGERVDGVPLAADYWWRNVRSAVRLAPALEELAGLDVELVVEVGPHPVLSGSIRRSREGVVALPSLVRREDEQETMAASAAGLWAHGVDVDWGSWWEAPRRCVALPPHPWRRKRYWNESGSSRRTRLPDDPHPLLGRPIHGAHPAWRGALDRAHRRWLDDHRVRGRVVFPAAGFLEILAAAARRTLDASGATLDDVRIGRGLFLPLDRAPEVETVADPAGSTLTVASRVGGEDGEWVEHCRATYRPVTGEPERGERDPGRASDRTRTRDGFYSDLEAVGLDYGPAFRSVREVTYGEGSVLARVELPPDVGDGTVGYGVHPTLLDGCLQAVHLALPDDLREEEQLYLPERFERVRVWGEVGREVWSEVRLVEATELTLVADVTVRTDAGDPVLEVKGFRCRVLDAGEPSKDVAEATFGVRWLHRPLPGTAPPTESLPAAPALPTLVRRAHAAARGAWGEGRLEDLTEAAAFTDELARCHVVAALEELAGTRGEGAAVDLDAWVAEGRLGEGGRPLLERCLADLEEEGWVRRGEEGRRIVEPGVGTPPFAGLWRRALARHPELRPRLRLVELAGRRLPAVWSGRAEPGPPETVLGEEATELLAAVERSAPWMRYANTLVRELLARVVRELPGPRPLRILELGGGTGATAEAVLPVLPPGRTEYWLTDPSSQLLASTERRLVGPEVVRFQRLHRERALGDQGIPAGTFDVVIVGDAFRAGGSDRDAVRRTAELLVESGLLVVRSRARAGAAHRVVYASDSGPFLTGKGWKTLLGEEGFEDPTAAPPCSHTEAHTEVGTVLAARRGAAPPARVSRVNGSAEAEPEAAARPEPSDRTPDGVHWMVFGAADGPGDRVVAALRERGRRCVRVEPGPELRSLGADHFAVDAGRPGELERLREEVRPPGEEGSGLVWLVEPSEGSGGGLDPDGVVSACESVLNLLRTFASGSAPDVRSLVLVTRGVAVLVGDGGEPGRALQAAVDGLGRVAATEFPRVEIRMVDLEAGTESVKELVAELEDGAGDPQEEVAWRGGRRFVPRIVTAREAPPEPPSSPEPPGTAFEVVVGKTGELDTVEARAVESRSPGAGEVRVEVRYAALNFRDVLKALGNYPVDEARFLALGDECAGVVRDVGSGVVGLEPGDRVVLSGVGLLRSEVTLPAAYACPVPVGFDLAGAAGLPVAHLTADYALREVARLRAGETVLVHSAAGGVGLAALRIARAEGARVFATAGTPAKRELLVHLGAERVMDSRSLDFADEVRAVTDGRGVDVVLNSLAGQAMERSLSTLAARGRFVELGRRDFFENTRVGLRPLRDNCSYHAVDLSVLVDRPEEAARRLRRLVEECAAGDAGPLPMRVEPVSRVSRALRRMARGGHVGKIVLDMARPGRVRTPAPRIELRPDRTYLVTGGFGGVGRELARWLAEWGARHLVLMGRRGAHHAEARELLDELRTSEVEVRDAAVDVTDREALAELLAEVDEEMPPLAGVFHLAMVLDDVTIPGLTADRLEAVVRPKVHGAWNLHRLTRDAPLEHFVLFGSAAASFGNFGQAAYAAANAALDGLAAHRRAAGLPGTCIAWGMLGEVGCVAERPDLGASLERAGVRPLSTSDLRTGLEAALASDEANRVVLRSDWGTLSRTLGASQRLPGLFEPLLQAGDGEEDAESDAAARALLDATDSEARRTLAVEFVRAKLAAVLGTSPSRVETDRPLTEMGLDSLMGVELVDRISRELGVALPLASLSRDVTVEAVAARLLPMVGGGVASGERERTAEAPSPSAGPAPRLVHLAGEPEAPPVCCIHPAGGDLGVYDELGAALAPGCRVQGVESRMLAGGEEEFPSLAAMGSAYADLLLQRRSEGPVRLVGFSMGGLVALETARELERRGKPVDLVALVEFDPTPVTPDERVPRVARFLAVLFEHLQRQRLVLKEGALDRLEGELPELAERIVEAGAEAAGMIVEWLARRDALREEAEGEVTERYVRAMAAHLELFAAPRSGDRPAADSRVWLASRGLYPEAVARARRDGGAPGRGVTVLPADHFSILTPPHVGRIAGELLRLVREGAPSSSRTSQAVEAGAGGR